MNARQKTATLLAIGGALSTLLLLPAKPERDKPQPKPSAGVERSEDTPRIQIALLLDTSGSMSGLIDQARSELWRVVNELAEAKHQGRPPELEIALYEYGNSKLSMLSGYIRQVVPFTVELDQVSEQLFALRTSGGSEHVGETVKHALDHLQWDDAPGSLKMIFVAGNEPFDQGSIPPDVQIRRAAKLGVTVNTVYCGSDHGEVARGWKNGAMLADGRFMTIDHHTAVVQIAAPQDQEIARLGVELNRTYIPYGAHGAAGHTRQAAQDKNASQAFGLSNLSRRSVSKASKHYRNPSWELIDALAEGRVKLEELRDASLPPKMRDMDQAQRRSYINEMRQTRESIKRRIQELNEARRKFVDSERKKKAGANSLDIALIGAVRDQAQKKGYDFE